MKTLDIQPVTLTGRLVRLEPLMDMHSRDLAEVGLEPQIWKYMRYGKMETIEDLRNWIRSLLDRRAAGTDFPFAVIYLPTQKAVGVTRYLNIKPEHLGLEIGGTWYGLAYQRTGVNTESKFLLLKHAFEQLSCIRVQFKTDTRNERSRIAIERLGAVREGVLRKDMILPDGTVRSSIYYSILDEEWPAVRLNLLAKLDQYN